MKHNPIGSNWDDFARKTFTADEIAASDLRVAVMNEIIKARQEQGYTPPNMGRPMPQAPKPSHRPQSQIFLPSFVLDEDVIDADYTEVHRAASQPTTKVKSNKGGGRPRKYSTAAERQAAYRERKHALEC
ncbi:hypothetical protein QEO94_11380 [Kingella negevensis]|uniref:hypothetical protein n=1 Tax=Kingella negevensis TaxID=1522312 RepID=UPI0025435EAA|nr:hypothetical protein [Kingella negevensis]WII93201.1 hypothetical protein QEO94_11380 [Kingella negevensis]